MNPLLDLITEFILMLCNRGLLMIPLFGAVILLRPVTNKLLRPKYRVWLWLAGWIMCSVYHLHGEIVDFVQILPVTLRTAVLPRTEWGNHSPAYLPSRYLGAGEYTAVLPGGKEVALSLSDGGMILFCLAYIAGTLLVSWWCVRLEKNIMAGVEKGEIFRLPSHPELGMKDERVAVRLCRGLPTSFVIGGRERDMDQDIGYVIYLQEELPEERRELVLLHEIEHLRQHHLWFKGILAMALSLFWWNPVVWLAYRLTCRDLELSCDEAVMSRLEGIQRREYARTLLELGAGKQFWGMQLSFGECDAAIRVRRAVDWRRERMWEMPLALVLTVLLSVVVFTSPASPGDEIPYVRYLNGYVQNEGDPILDDDLRAQFGERAGVKDIWLVRGGYRVLVELTDGQWVYGNLQRLNHKTPRMEFVPVETPTAEKLEKECINYPR